MGLQDKIKQKKIMILNRCFNLISDTYPPATSQLLKREKDRFLNPVGYTIQNEIEIIFDELAGEMNSNRLYTALEGIIKIRAVQDFSPSEAVGFVFFLKKAVREEVTKDRLQWVSVLPSSDSIGGMGVGVQDNETEIFEGLLELEQRIDGIALMAFDIYMECREKIHEIKTKEIKLRAKSRGFEPHTNG